MEIKNIGIVGSGQMGSGIAQVAAACGYNVILNDVSKDLAEKGKKSCEKGYSKLVSKEKMSAEDMQAALARISATDKITDLKKADFVWFDLGTTQVIRGYK